MAVVNRTSNLITNNNATPRVANNANAGQNADLKETVGLVTPAADDSATSVQRYVRVPSNARVSELKITCAQASTAGALDVGVHETTENGGAAVDADFFATAQSLSAAALNDADILNESTTNTLAKQVQPLWQALGLSADPRRDYDITATISTTFNGGPTAIKLRCRYAQ